MDFITELKNWQLIAVFCGCAAVLVLLLGAMVTLVVWAKTRPVGAYVILAMFPLISLFPMPPAEVKKLEQIKKEQIHQDEESGEPPNDSVL
jgi:hypothetical protein